MNNIDKFKSMFLVRVKPVSGITEPLDLGKGEAGFYFPGRVWVLRDPDTGELVVPNKYEADLSLIAQRLSNGVFTADKIGNIRFYKDLADVNNSLTVANVTLQQLLTLMVDFSIIYLKVDAGNNLNGIMPNTKGGIVKFSRFTDTVYGEFDVSDGNKLLINYKSGAEIKWKPAADFTLIERSALTDYINPVVNTNTIGSMGFNAKGNTARKNLVKNVSFGDSATGWTINGGSITANTDDYVELTGNGSSATITLVQDIDYVWQSYSHLISRMLSKAAEATSVSFQFNDSANTKVTSNSPIDWTLLDHDSNGLTLTSNNKVRITITFTFSSAANASGKKCYISKSTPITVNSIYATSLKLKGIKDYNKEYNDRSAKLALTVVGSNKFNKYKVTSGYKLVNGALTADPLYFVSDFITIGNGFNIFNATTIAWTGKSGSSVLNGTTKTERNKNFNHSSFRFSGLLSEIDKILLTSQENLNDSYERYTESIISVDLELKGISNYGSSYLYDEVYNISTLGYPDKMIHVKRISDAVTINTNEISLANGVGNQYITIPLTQFPNLKPQTNGAYDNSFFISGVEREVNTGITTNGSVFAFETTATNLIIAFPTGTFANIDEAKVKLATYTIYYEITPIITELKLINTMVPSNCTVIQSHAIRTNLSFNLPINNGASFSDMYNKIEEMSEALNNVGELGLGGTGGPLSETAVYKTPTQQLEFQLPLQAYNPSSDLLIVSTGAETLIKDRDYKIDATTKPMRFIKLDPSTGMASSTPWSSGMIFKFIAIISNGVSDRYIIPTKFESNFEVMVDDTDRIPIQIPLFNPLDDDIFDAQQENFNIYEGQNFVIENGTITHNGVEYSGYYIRLLDYTADTGVRFHFRLLKGFRSADTLNQIDPVLIRAGITDSQLAESIRIGNKADLLTVFKTNIVGAINEVVSTKIGIGAHVDKTHGVTDPNTTLYPALASFFDNRSDINGVIKITMPYSWCNAFISGSLRIKANNTKLFSILFSAFANQTTNLWENVAAFIEGNYNTTAIRFAHHNGKLCMFIGVTGTTIWSKPTLSIDTLQIANNNSNWSDGWSIQLLTAAEMTAITPALTSVVYAEPVLGWTSVAQGTYSSGNPLSYTESIKEDAPLIQTQDIIASIDIRPEQWDISPEGSLKDCFAKIPVSGVSKSSWVNVRVDSANRAIVDKYGISLIVEEYDGGIFIYADELPEEVLIVKMNITNMGVM